MLTNAAVAAEKAKDKTKATQQLQQIQRNIKTLQQDIGVKSNRQTALSRELRALEQDIARARAELHTLEAQLGRQQTELDELRGRVSHLELELARHRHNLARQLRAAYASGGENGLRLLLNQEDPARNSRMNTYFHYLSRARSEAIGDTRSTLAELESASAQLNAHIEALAQLKQDQRQRQQQLAQAQQQRQRVLLSLEQSINTEKQRLARLQEDEQQLKKLLERLRKDISKGPADFGKSNFAKLKGRLPWPLKGSRIASRFGAPRGDGRLRWEGVTLTASAGQEVRAVAPGRVAYADFLRGYGQMLIIDHGGNFMTLYGQNERLLKRTGDRINAGDVIANAGNEPGRGGLYFEIRYRGQPLDPAAWCR